MHAIAGYHTHSTPIKNLAQISAKLKEVVLACGKVQSDRAYPYASLFVASVIRCNGLHYRAE